MRTMQSVLALVAVLLVLGCVLRPEPVKASYSETGTATWYGEDFLGKPTASGELFDPTDLTAAHKMLPFGTIVMVSNLDNSRSVTVRINDRGPFKPGCIIDLSQAAAQQLGMIESGSAHVRIDVMGMQEDPGMPGPDEIPGTDEIPGGVATPGVVQTPGSQEIPGAVPGPVAVAPGQEEEVPLNPGQTQNQFSFVVQVASFTDPVKAAALFEQLLASGFHSASIRSVDMDGSTLYRVRAGGYQTLDQAQAAVLQVRQSYPDAFVAQGP